MSRVEVDGVGIEYQVHGAGRPVVLLHGFPDTGRLWRHQVPALAEAGFQVIAELEANGSLTPGLNYYRANIPPESWAAPPMQLPPVQAPAMGMWSTGDVALTEVQMTDSAKNVAGSWRYERLDGPGHWMQLEAPDQVTALLLDFLPR